MAEDNRVIAYYSLAPSNIASREAGGCFRRNMPDPVPVVTLARLAVDRAFQKHGLGRNFIQDAARRVMAAANVIGIRGNDRLRHQRRGQGLLPPPRLSPIAGQRNDFDDSPRRSEGKRLTRAFDKALPNKLDRMAEIEADIAADADGIIIPASRYAETSSHLKREPFSGRQAIPVHCSS